MYFTDIFIRRPVLATVISLVILVLGLRSLTSLPILQFPKMENAVVTVSTAYYGASADVVAGFITSPLENSIAQADGIDYLSSTSTQGLSSITATLRLNADTNAALTQISTRVNAVRNQLPPESQQSVISVAIGQTVDSMYIGFNSDVLPPNKITDYILRVVQPKLQAIEGVQQVVLFGEKRFALRVWLDPQKLAAYNITATEVNAALARNDYLAALGSTKGQSTQIDLTASTSLHSVEEFRRLIVKTQNGASVYLEDVANITLGAEDYETVSHFDGKRAVQVGIKVVPSANLLDVITRVREALPEIQAELPEGLTATIGYDASTFVQKSIKEVVLTLIEALVIVTLVVFAFLGSPRSVLIPVVAIPLSLIGAFGLMLVFGFTINLLTLLALVLAIGLVVDDAIIVVENVNRHLEEGVKPFPAAIMAARELARPIIAMTVVLVAVYVPIGFIGGLTGALFTEFAFTLVGAVTVSAIVALTLSPMMCARMLQPHEEVKNEWERKLVTYIDEKFAILQKKYQRALHWAMEQVAVIAVFAGIVLVSIYFLFTFSHSELAPNEDQGVLISLVNSSSNATVEQRELNQEKVYQVFASQPEQEHTFQISMPGFTVSGLVLKPWDERDRSAGEMLEGVQQGLNNIASAQVSTFNPPPLPGSSGLPIALVIQTTEPFERLYEVAENFLVEARKSGRFLFVDSDLKYNKGQATVVIDREKTAQLGLTMQDVGSSLSAMLGGNYVNYFSMAGRSYRVISQVQREFRLNPEQLKDYYIRTASGVSVPLSTIATIDTKTVPQSLNHFQQLNSATIAGVPMIGVSAGDSLAYLQELTKTMLPQGYTVDYSGQSRQYVQESSAIALTFAFALLIIFLTLSAQYESFRDPVIILITVPMSICGALIFISLGIGGASINIYTQVGLITLIGLISKHGILMVEFANQLQAQGRSKREAIEEASAIRLRPILMTTAAMVLGVMPLVFASGAGAVARYNLGLVIATGISIGTLFTLFVVPAMYVLLAADHHKKDDDEEERMVEV